MSKRGALRMATCPPWPGSEIADAAMEYWLSGMDTLGDEVICEELGITQEQFDFIKDRCWDWRETPTVDLDEEGRPRLRLVDDEAPTESR